ncbi:MAG: ABC transporter substrate-binding protein, partial [Chloroflexota bacterium]
MTECPADERVFDHEKLFGNAVCVPELPQRIVSLSGVSTEALVALGISPVGTLLQVIDDIEEYYPDYADLLVEIDDLGSPPNIEALTALDPDLIIGLTGLASDFYRQLSQIAPTVLFEFEDSSAWKEASLFTADAVGEAEALEQLLLEYEVATDALQMRLTESDI